MIKPQTCQVQDNTSYSTTKKAQATGQTASGGDPASNLLISQSNEVYI